LKRLRLNAQHDQLPKDAAIGEATDEVEIPTTGSGSGGSGGSGVKKMWPVKIQQLQARKDVFFSHRNYKE